MKKNTENAKQEIEKPKVSWGRSLIYILVSLLLLAADQLSKMWVINNDTLMNGGSIELIPDMFKLRYAFNTGAAFSMLANQDWGIYLLSGISILATILFLVLLVQYSNWPVIFPLAASILLAGTVGNLIDRLAYGGVHDFLDFYRGDWHFPTFNIADACITVGAIIFFVLVLFFHDRYLRKYNEKLYAQEKEINVREFDAKDI